MPLLLLWLFWILKSHQPTKPFLIKHCYKDELTDTPNSTFKSLFPSVGFTNHSFIKLIFIKCLWCANKRAKVNRKIVSGSQQSRVVRNMGLVRKTWVIILVWLLTSSLTWGGMSSLTYFLICKIRWYLFCTVPGLYIKHRWLIVTATATVTAAITDGTYHLMCDTDTLAGKYITFW